MGILLQFAIEGPTAEFQNKNSKADEITPEFIRATGLLQDGQVMTHPFIRLELALGSIANRDKVLVDLALLPQARRLGEIADELRFRASLP